MLLYWFILTPILLIIVENSVVNSNLVSINNLNQASNLSNEETNDIPGLERQLTRANSFFSAAKNPLNVFKTGKWPKVGKFMSRGNVLVGFAATIIGLFWFWSVHCQRSQIHNR